VRIGLVLVLILKKERQVLRYFPLNKKFTKLLQLGVIGYDQWQVTADSGTLASGLPASVSPFYSVRAVGGQVNFILPVTPVFLLLS
jgi:hypothetical protein